MKRMMTRNSSLLSYGVALLSVALALAVSLLLSSFIQPTPLALFYMAVIASAWYGGLKPGLVATVLSTLAINYFIPPYNSLSIINPGNLLRLGVFVSITLLITGLDQARRVALRQEQQLRAEAENAHRRTANLLEHMTDAFVVFDRHWHYTYANPAALQLLQKSSEELIGKNVWEEVFPSEKGGLAYRQLHRALEEQVSVSWEEFGKPVQRWLEVRAYPSLEGIAVYFQDISERKRAEASLRQSEEQLRLATEGANIGLWYWDLATDRLIWTDQAKAMFGLPVDTKMSMQVFLEAVHPDDRHFVHTIVSDLQAGQLHTEDEYRTLWADGTVRWILAKGNSTYDTEGNLISTRGVLIDITDRKRIEEELRKSEQQLRSAIEVTQFSPYEWNPVTGELIWDAQLKAMWGLAPDAKVNLAVHNAGLHPQDREYVEQQAAKAIDPNGDGIFEAEFRVIGIEDRIERWISARGQTFFDAERRPVYYVGAAQDISDRKRVEEDLRRSEAAFRTISNAAPALVWVSSPKGEISFFNDRWYEFTGQTEAEALGSGWAETMHPDDAARILPYWKRCQQTGETYEGEVRYRRHDGEYRWHAFRALPRRNSNGEIEAWYGLSVDISDRRRIEAELQQNQLLLQSIIDNAGILIYVKDLEGRFILVNQQFERVFGLSKQEFLGKTDYDFFAPELADAFREKDRLVLAGEPMEFEELSSHVDGLHNYISVKFPLHDATGRIYAICGISTDITDRKQAELEIQKFVSLANNSTEFIGMCDMNFIPFYINEAGLRTVGLEGVHQFKDTPVQEFFFPEDQDFIVNEFFPCVLREGQAEVEIRFRHFKTGEAVWMIYNVFYIRGENNQPIGLATVSRNITERKRIEAERNQAEATLRESEERFRTLAATVPQLIWTAMSDGSVNYLSEQWADYIGLPPERLYDWNWQQVVHPDDLPNTLKDWQQSLQSGEPLEIQHRFRYHTGEWRWQLVRGIPVKDETGRVTKWVGTCTDIHESELRKQDAQFLSDLSEAIRTIDHADHLMTTAIEMIGQYLQLKRCYFAQTDEANDRAWITSDYHDSLPSLVGEHLLSHYPAIVLELLRSGHLYISNDNKHDPRSVDCYSTVYEPLAIRAHVAVPFFMDGHWAVNLIAATNEPRQWQEREINLLETAAERIWLAVEKLRSEVALRESEDRYRALTELSPQLVFMSRPDGSITYVNQWGLDFTGRSLSELQGDGWAECIHPEYRDRVYEAWTTATSNVSDYDIEILFRHADGVYRWLYTHALPVTNDAGEIEYWIGVAIDITDRKQAEADREQLLAREKAAREAAETASRIKDEFLAVVSHELRSPLNPILGWAKLLRGHQLNAEKTDRALEVIERNAQMQSQLINDLLDVSRILRGKLSLDAKPIDLVSTIQGALETVRLAAEVKSIQIHTQFESHVGYVAGDAGRLQQVIWNLLSNAVKFTSEGGRVDIRLSLVSGHSSFETDSQLRTNDQGQITTYAQITVSDTGKGIPADFLPYVFEQFRQESSATTRRFGGLGLGLAIVRYLVELHGGTVQADSPGEGQGAIFTVKLPLLPHQPALNQDTEPSKPFLDLQGIRILVVDDDDNTREFLAFLLELHKANVIATASATEAITTLIQFKPDLLLSDIGMPDVDGYMLMRQVRALPPEQGGTIPAIALTAYAGEIDYQQAMAAGFQQHLSKPIEPEVLVSVIAHLLHRV